MKFSRCVKSMRPGLVGGCEKELFRIVDRELADSREKYVKYMNEPHLLYEALEKGAEKARAIAKVNLAEIKKRIDLKGNVKRSLVFVGNLQ